MPFPLLDTTPFRFIEGMIDELVNICLDKNSESEDEFDSWEDFYDWGAEILLTEYNHKSYELNDLPPIFIHTHL